MSTASAGDSGADDFFALLKKAVVAPRGKREALLRGLVRRFPERRRAVLLAGANARAEESIFQQLGDYCRVVDVPCWDEFIGLTDRREEDRVAARYVWERWLGPPSDTEEQAAEAGADRDGSAKTIEDLTSLGAVWADAMWWSSEEIDLLGAEAYRSSRYKIEERLGKGGFGEVLSARDRLLRRRVAIKRMFFRPQPSRSEQVLRFLQEAQFMGQLNHPGIPPVHDVGIDRSGVPYYVMRLVRGRTLAEVIEECRGQVTIDWLRGLTRVLIKVVNTLRYAHSKKVIHGDLSPRNIMVGSFGEVQVLDWGLARLTCSNQDQSQPFGRTQSADSLKKRIDEAIERSSGAKGSPGYLAPEAVRRSDRPLPSWDVYSLGAILYDALSGGPPYAREMVRSDLDFVDLLLGGPPMALERIVGGKFESWCRVATRCIDRSGDYIPTMGELLGDLMETLDKGSRSGVSALICWVSPKKDGAGLNKRHRRAHRVRLSKADLTLMSVALPPPAGSDGSLDMFVHEKSPPPPDFVESLRDRWARFRCALEFFGREQHDVKSPGLTTKFDSRLHHTQPDERLLGMGGQAIVSLGRERILDRPIAIKRSDSPRRLAINLPHQAQAGAPENRLADFLSVAPDDRLIGLVVREAQILSQLEHPGALPVHDVGIDSNGPNFAMHLVRGQTLDAEWSSEEMSLWRVVAVILDLAEVLSYAHRRGVIHRDVKPQNIMCGRFGEVHMIDWALARLTPATGKMCGLQITYDPFENESGRIMGTPAYMSPEQARGEPAGFTSDIYSLGITLFESIAGLPDLTGQDINQVVRIRAEGRKPEDPRDRNPTVPKWLSRLCQQALQPKPSDRFSSMDEFAEALRSGLDKARPRELSRWKNPHLERA